MVFIHNKFKTQIRIGLIFFQYFFEWIESVNGHFRSNLCLNCIFKWTWFVKTSIWSVIDRSRIRFPVEAPLIFFLPFYPFISLFWLGSPSVPLKFPKLVNAQPSNFVRLRIFWSEIWSTVFYWNILRIWKCTKKCRPFFRFSKLKKKISVSNTWLGPRIDQVWKKLRAEIITEKLLLKQCWTKAKKKMVQPAILMSTVVNCEES